MPSPPAPVIEVKPIVIDKAKVIGVTGPDGTSGGGGGGGGGGDLGRPVITDE